MNTLFHSYVMDSPPLLIDTLSRYAEAGIDPAFDSDMDELERQFAEYRLSTLELV